MRLKGLRRVLVDLLIDTKMASSAAIDAGNRFERLIHEQIAQQDLIHALRLVEHVEY